MRQRALFLFAALLLQPVAYGATRAEYAAAIRRGADDISALHLARAAKAEAKATVVGRGSIDYALMEAFLARHCGQTERAAKAKRVLMAVNRCALEGADPQKKQQFQEMEFALYNTSLIVTWLKEMRQLNEDESGRSEAMLKACADGILKYIPERGSMNRAALAGLGAAAIARLYPDVPHASAWRQFSDLTWGDWWPYRDTFEDSSNYNALWLFGILLQAEQLGKADDLKCRDVDALLERYYQLVSPVGIIPDYGDAMWASAWDLWVAVFERGAGLFGRADLKRAADAIFRYASRQPRACGPGLVHAWFWARDDLQPGEMPHKSLYTTRRDAYGRTLFDKLILRAGPAGKEAYVLVNLHDSGYHGHNDGCALCAFVVGESVLLHETGYHQHADED